MAWIQQPIGLQLAIHPYTKSMYGSCMWKLGNSRHFLILWLLPCTFGVAVFLVWKLEEFELTTACYRHILMMWSCDLLGTPSPQPSPNFWAYCPQLRGGHGEQAFLTMKQCLFDWLKVCMQIAKAVIFLLVNSCQILRKIISKSPDLHDKFQESSNTSFAI